MANCQFKCDTSCKKTSIADFQARHFRGLELIKNRLCNSLKVVVRLVNRDKEHSRRFFAYCKTVLHAISIICYHLAQINRYITLYTGAD